MCTKMCSKKVLKNRLSNKKFQIRYSHFEKEIGIEKNQSVTLKHQEKIRI